MYETDYETRASTYRTGYETRAIMYETDYETRASTYRTGYETRAIMYETDYETRASTYRTGYEARASTYRTDYETRAIMYETGYETQATTYRTGNRDVMNVTEREGSCGCHTTCGEIDYFPSSPRAQRGLEPLAWTVVYLEHHSDDNSTHTTQLGDGAGDKEIGREKSPQLAVSTPHGGRGWLTPQKSHSLATVPLFLILPNDVK
ncbi:hypothetical protein MJG53_012497 [Ovis ammon polii x Ovis aries]|uniref:Uncharacterized protein n=1 Tax=Ovis ammon polii x Ovis aries TaxID=2918886 RepID=A0ACB9UNQ6_9CETA|nr:hypothetical protein MJG53_012497 [Ovis ammon polii x Ovis aries]